MKIILFHINRLLGKYIGIVGFQAINDYHFYWDKKKKEFFFVGLDNEGFICEISPIKLTQKKLLKEISNMNIHNTLNPIKAFELREKAKLLL